ncbi:MAG: metallophosphoesterase [Clostridia bacterium]|nr:metallophosphoesterase [Clostridia bacterium]
METTTAEKKEKIVVKKNPKRHLKRFLIVLAVAVCVAVIGTVATVVTLNQNLQFAKSLQKVSYENQLVPTQDENGVYTFVTDEEFKVMQLTDIHFGGGWMSAGRDKKTINCLAALVTAEKPDLVIATGDIAYPVPFQAGTFNNKSGAKLFAQTMESLGVYWTLNFGNHDTEAYSYYSREKISDFYSTDMQYCLFSAGPEDIDGYGNHFVKVCNTKGEITQALFMLDSGSYTDGDILGIKWYYDNVHDNQIEWYKQQVAACNEHNAALNADKIKSMLFIHIPFEEYEFAWEEYKANDHKDTENVKYYFGRAGETDELVYNSKYENGLFEALLENGTQAVFCGHDHFNCFSVDYKGIRLTYGLSVDYLAYDMTHSISTQGSQRGCTVITVQPDGTADIVQKNYYKDGFPSVTDLEKEEVTLQWDAE